jgi:hypothetical protein
MNQNIGKSLFKPKLSLPLLQSVESIGLNNSMHSSIVRGSYSAMQFAVRLSKQVHSILDTVEIGFFSGKNDFRQYEAFSTLLHENIHWWQYMGSNFGVVSSLKFPAQTHVTLPDLRDVISTKGAFKSIVKYDDIKVEDGNIENCISINRVLNNWHDLEIANRIIWKPELVKEHLHDRFFISVSHCFSILWASATLALASSVDQNFSFLPHPKDWEKELLRIRNQEEAGNGGNSYLIPLGVKAIMEGQARLSQLQYLSWHSPSTLTLQYFKENNLLDGYYFEALHLFLQTLGEPIPNSPHDSLIGLFLLICDISLNPYEGFPFPIMDFDNFTFSNDPSKRFYTLCLMVRDKLPHLKKAIRNYSKEEYVSISKELTHSMADVLSPYECASYVAAASEKEPAFIDLLVEESDCSFKEGNLPVRVFFSKYLRFQQDKAKYPQFFCWPGISMGLHEKNTLSSDLIMSLFHKHHALFINREDDNIYPVLFKGVPEANIDTMFNRFYTWNATYGLIRQWIAEDGPFEYDFNWLTTKWTPEQVKDWAGTSFERMVGAHPDSFEIL